MKQAKATIRFDGESHQIDAATLIEYMSNYCLAVNQISNLCGDGSRKVSVKVNALPKGSFVIDMSLCETVLQTLFSRGSVDYLANVTTICGAVYALYRHFKGHPIKTEEQTKEAEECAKNCSQMINNNFNIAVNVYNDKGVRRSISNSIKAVRKDQCVLGVRTSWDGGGCVEIKRDEFEDLSYDDFEDEDARPKDKTEEVDATLVITSLNFESGKTWSFIYNGFPIKFIVNDDALMRRINDGERFGKGDAIKVRMKIIKTYDAKYGGYVNRSYKITEFVEHIEAPRQPSLFDKVQAN